MRNFGFNSYGQELDKRLCLNQKFIKNTSLSQKTQFWGVAVEWPKQMEKQLLLLLRKMSEATI